MNPSLAVAGRRALLFSNATTKNVLSAPITRYPGGKPRVSSWQCPACTRSLRTTAPVWQTKTWPKQLHTSSRRFNDTRPPEPTLPRASTAPKPSDTALPSSSSTSSLPSKSDSQRWPSSRRMAHLMDSVLARASVAGQHINNYTGTDYSGIEAIKHEISAQEEKVEACHSTIATARSTHRDAHAKQAASQKEIVSLLERKSSWSPEDLERYMSLVRSEHGHEQAIQAAKDGLEEAERDLESARGELERLERKQYHEEQIWSDTIRRNSTWVTFGLMGLNIFLLLAQIAIFEPWRRRRIVKEVQRALDEKHMFVNVGPAAAVERQIDAVVEPKGVPIEVAEVTAVPDQTPTSTASSGPNTTLATDVPPTQEAALPPSPLLRKPQTWPESWDYYKERLHDLFSERIVQVKRVDITTTALQGAATGVAAMGLLFVLWRPK